MKLEIKHLAPYLPYSLKVSKLHTMHTCLGIGSIDHILTTQKEAYKPILRPLSDLTKEIEIDGKKFVPKESIGLIHDISGNNILNFRTGERIDVLCLPYFMVEKLFEWHFDVFGLIDQGLALPLI